MRVAIDTYAKPLLLVSTFLALVALNGCFLAVENSYTGDSALLTSGDGETILFATFTNQEGCLSCHPGLLADDPSTAQAWVDNFNALWPDSVIPGDGANSGVVLSVGGDSSEWSPMPEGGPAVDEADVTALSEYIDSLSTEVEDTE